MQKGNLISSESNPDRNRTTQEIRRGIVSTQKICFNLLKRTEEQGKRVVFQLRVSEQPYTGNRTTQEIRRGIVSTQKVCFNLLNREQKNKERE